MMLQVYQKQKEDSQSQTCNNSILVMPRESRRRTCTQTAQTIKTTRSMVVSYTSQLQMVSQLVSVSHVGKMSQVRTLVYSAAHAFLWRHRKTQNVVRYKTQLKPLTSGTCQATLVG